MLLLFLNDVLYHPSGESGSAGNPEPEKKDENEEKDDEETITLKKSEYEAKLQQKFAEGARKAQTSGLTNKTQEEKNENKEQKNGENQDDFAKLKYEVELLRGEKLAIKQGVKPEYAEDAVALLKGKGLEVNEENMKSIIDKHPEWKLSNSSSEASGAKPLGSTGGKSTPPAVDEKEQAAKLFGL